MTEYLYCAVSRRSDGALGPTLHTQIIEASSAEDAIAMALAIDLDMEALDANAVVVRSREDDRIIWILHTDPVEIR